MVKNTIAILNRMGISQRVTRLGNGAGLAASSDGEVGDIGAVMFDAAEEVIGRFRTPLCTSRDRAAKGRRMRVAIDESTP